MLHEEQQYVFEIAKKLGIEPKLIYHERPTISCSEKLDLLKENSRFKNWTLDRIVKAVYFQKNNHPFIGVVTPEFGTNIRPREIFPGPLGISKSKAEKYWVDPNRVPKGMSWGTCTPFPLSSTMDSEISDIIFINFPSINDQLVDISIGGINKESFVTSMHLPYLGIYQILKKQFGERVHRV